MSDLLATASPRPWGAPVAMEQDEFYGEYTRIPLTDKPDGNDLVIFGGDEDCALIVQAVNEYDALLGVEAEARRLFADHRMAGLLREFLAQLDEIRSA